MSQETSTSTHSHTDIEKLRTKLASVIWVQCDLPSCLKWRKVRSELANQLTENTHWNCSMNEDTEHNRCDIAEEDTKLYDKLARKAKLDLIKSELKPGSLVWAKTEGYCRWPAVVTADPANGRHCEGDDIEMLWYHVEYISQKPCHGWVRGRSVELFGPGNQNQIESASPHCGPKKKGKYQSKLKMIYNKSQTVQQAVTEALTLVSLSLDERLQLCFFKEKRDGAVDLNTQGEQTARVKSKKKTGKCPNSIGKSVQRNKRIKAGKSASEINKMLIGSISCSSSSSSKDDGLNSLRECQAEESFLEVKRNETLEYLLFPSSLLHSSKEERLIMDIQSYQRNEKAFAFDFAHFMSCSALNLPKCPVWNSCTVSLFEVFLAVYERGGFLQVSEDRKWSQVYEEIMNHQVKGGGMKAKNFYKKILLPYECFLTDEKVSLKAKKSKLRKRKTSSSLSENAKFHGGNFKTSDGTDFYESQDKFNREDLDNDFEKLDKMLQSLQDSEAEGPGDMVVPTLMPETPAIYNWEHGGSYISSQMKVVTGSEFGLAQEPDENAQVVPDMDIPSSSESNSDENQLSQHSDDQIFHELQALQYEMDFMQDEIDKL